MQKTLQIPVFLKAKQKIAIYSIFGGLIAKNAGIYTVFAISRKRGRHETLWMAVFWPLLGTETCVNLPKAPCSCCRKVLRNAATLQTAHARFPLLCTPSRTLHQAEWPAEARDARALHPKCGPVRASNISHQKKTNLSDSAFHPRSR